MSDLKPWAYLEKENAKMRDRLNALENRCSESEKKLLEALQYIEDIKKVWRIRR